MPKIAIQQKREAAPEAEASGAEAAPKAKASGPGTADTGYLDLNQAKTPEEWKEFVDTSGLKLTTLEAEVSELGECIAAVHKEKLGLLDGLLNEAEYVINFALLRSAGGNIKRKRNYFSDFLALLSSFKEVFNKQIAGIDHLVNGNQGSPLGLILEATAKAKTDNNI